MAAGGGGAPPSQQQHSHSQQPQQRQLHGSFLVRVVALDYYMAPPVAGLDACFSSLEGAPVERVPVVRVFGATPAGQKACVHLHRVRAKLGVAAGSRR